MATQPILLVKDPPTPHLTLHPVLRFTTPLPPSTLQVAADSNEEAFQAWLQQASVGWKVCQSFPFPVVCPLNLQ